MFLILLSLLTAVAVGVTVSMVGAGWFFGILAGVVAFLIAQILLGRRLRKRLEPALAQVQRQVEAGMLKPALDSLQNLLPLGSWVPLLRGQLYAQMGVIAFHAGKKDDALEYLKKASRRSSEAQLLLASMLDRGGDYAAARKALDRAAPYQKKSDFFQNVQAYILHKNGDTPDALTRLNRFADKEGGEVTKDNVSRLQNDRKMNLKPFGMPWYALGYERPPASMGQMQTGRKGFRQPPKSQKSKKR